MVTDMTTTQASVTRRGAVRADVGVEPTHRHLNWDGMPCGPAQCCNGCPRPIQTYDAYVEDYS